LVVQGWELLLVIATKPPRVISPTRHAIDLRSRVLAGAVTLAAILPSGGSVPQARLVTLVACGTRRVIAAATDSYAVSEQALVDQLGVTPRPGTLNLADRKFVRHEALCRIPGPAGRN
jgi:hypothetical protein